MSDLGARVEEAAEVATRLSEETMTDALAAMEVPDLLMVLRDLRRCIEDLRKIDAGIVRHLYLTAEHGDHDYPGIGRVGIRRGRDRKAWRHHDVAADVLDAHLTRLQGEIPEPEQVVGWLMEAMNPAYWRVTTLRGLGLAPDEYAESLPGKPHIEFMS